MRTAAILSKSQHKRDWIYYCYNIFEILLIVVIIWSCAVYEKL